ncbi:hypothetical protein CPB97_006509 [Podila verticillata]|nr:hypothetical protein CPB97_006509 [Podila verticillata]
MLPHKSKTTLHTHLTPEPSPRASPIPIYHPNSHQHNSNTNHHNGDSRLVRRAFTSIQHAFQPSSSKKSGATVEYNFDYDTSIDNTHDNYHPNNVHLPFSSNSYPSSNGHYINNNNAHYPHNNNPSKSSYASYSTLTPLNTDDDNSSSASFHSPRKLSKASMGPSPLGSSYPNTSSHALSSSSPPTTTLSSPAMSKVPSQLRVRHLERDATYAGYLTKFSSRTFFSRKQWKRRYFILHQRSLHCFKSSDPQHPLLESIALSADTIICVTDIFSGKRYCLQITCPGEKNWYVLADSAAEMSGWLKELKSTVLQFRTNIDSRPGTLYSDSSEISDRSASTTTTNRAVAIPVPAIPSQYDYSEHARSYSGSSPYSTATLMSSTSKAHINHGVSAHLHELYQEPTMATSLNPPPRATSPKLTLALGSSSKPNASGSPSHSGYQQQQPEPIQKQPEPTRRRNSSLSHAPPDYSSFGSVMQRAEALSTAQESIPTSSWTIPTKSEKIDTYATVPRSKRDSTVSSLASHKISVLVDRPETMITLPHRSSQRLMGSPSRPMSPVSSRPMSPNGRTSPRSSLVISPPPRSIHRPTSVSVRNSTQIFPPSSQLIALGLSSNSPLTSSAPNSSLPPTPEPSSDQDTPGSLSRITSLRIQPRYPGSRQSVIGLMNSSTPVGSGSLQERVQRNSSRSSIMKMASPTSPTNSASLRPLSPSPSLADAPTLPLPEPPRSESNSPSKASRHSVSLSTDSGVRLGRRSSSMVPRQAPDLNVPVRSRARERSLSQESDKGSRSLAELQMAFKAKATTPSPRLSAILTSTTSDKGQDDTKKSGSTYKQMSLPIHTNYVLPAPPTGQQPPQPKSDSPSTSLSNKQLPSASKTLRPISSNNGGVASLGGAVARRSSLANRDPVVAARLSALIAEPPTAAVPLPPVSASGPISGLGLPAPPTKAPPKKPNGVIFDIQGTNKKGFEIIVEEEEDEEEEEEEDEDDVEFTPLDIEGLSIGTGEQQDTETATSNATDMTSSSMTRPEYYAVKERKVVEYIFPSETFSS